MVALLLGVELGGVAGQPLLLEIAGTGGVVVMNNLRPHLVRERLEAAGRALIYLPSCSSDLSPIEPAWGKSKTPLRTLATRTKEARVSAISPALRAITAADARGYFTHCGYDLDLN